MSTMRILRPASISSYIQRLAPRQIRPVNSLYKPHTRPVSSIASCPSPSCACQDMPPDLDIERDKPLDGTMAAYHEHVMIPTGRVDWTSRIEEDPGLPFITQLKDALGQKGKYSNPYHNVMVTTTSTPSLQPETALLFPSFRQVNSISSSDPSFTNFIEGTLLPTKLHPQTDSLPPNSTAHLTRKPELASELNITDITDIHILICGHNSRDTRCGILGPILQQEFEEKLRSSKYKLKEPSQASANHTRGGEATTTESEVSQISHIGGHKYAGNLIIYVPPILKEHPLAGKGVWYGRVEPKHVEGIVKKTIEEGVVIKELFRGGINRDASMMRL